MTKDETSLLVCLIDGHQWRASEKPETQICANCLRHRAMPPLTKPNKVFTLGTL